MKNRFRKSKMLLLTTLIAVSPVVSLTVVAQENSQENVGDIQIKEVTPISIQDTGLGEDTTTTSEFEFSTGGDGKLTISRYTGTSKDLVLPNTVDGKDVTGISDDAFSELGLTSVSIPEGITEIGKNSFYGNEISILTLPSTLDRIGDEAFKNNKLVSITFNGINIVFGEGSFEVNNLTDIKLPTGTETIPARLFKGNSITSITLPTSIRNIGNEAFSLNSIASINLPSNLNTIGDSAFYNNKIESLYVPSKVTTIGTLAFARNGMKTLTIHKQFSTILNNSFSGNMLERLSQYDESNDPGMDITQPVVPPVVPPVLPPVVSDDNEDKLGFDLVSGELTLVKPKLSSNGFGSIKIGKTSVKSNLSFSSDLIVSDARGTNEGWSLTVQATPFSEVPVSGGTPPTGGWHTLPKGSLTLSGITSITQLDDSGNEGKPNSSFIKKNAGVSTLIDDGAVTLASAKKGEGSGVWSIEFPQNAITLTVTPSTARVDKVNYPNGPTPYQSTITWTVVSGPGQ